jgi:hypothetical protein
LEYRILRKFFAGPKNELQDLHIIIAELFIKLEDLERENEELKKHLKKSKNPKKNSSNSSISLSQDENRPKRKNLRGKTGCKLGGLKGRKGKTLQMVESPDNIIENFPNFCYCCGNDILELNSEFVGIWQVYGISKIKMEVTEHLTFKKVSFCDFETKSNFPVEANAPVSYSNKIESLISYFHAHQYIPFK